MTNSYKINLTTILFLGVVSSFSLPPYNYFILNFFTFSLFFIILRAEINKKINLLKTFFLGWSFGFGYFLASLYWISISISFDLNFKYLIPISLIIVSGFLAIFYGLSVLLFKFFFKNKNVFCSILIFCLSLGLFEFLRGNILTGFPWNLIGYSFSKQLEFIQINSIIGIYGFNLICINLFTLPALFFKRKNNEKMYPLFITLFLFLFSMSYGFFTLKNFDKVKYIPSEFKIVLISSQISLDRFYSSNDDNKIINELINLSDPSRFKNEKTVFIWPEGILPHTNVNNLLKFKDIIKKNFDNYHFIILGLNHEKIIKNEYKVYNSLVLINNSTEIMGIYDKKRLVPFGEFLPMQNVLSKIGLKSLTNNYQSYSPGKNKNQILSIKNTKFNFLPLICYEIIYSGQISSSNEFKYIINISEDGWFGNSVGVHQHFAHSIYRSIETGKYILRSSNNGITSIINPKGDIVSKVGIGDEGSLIFNKYKKNNKTFFYRYGNKIFFGIVLIYIILIYLFSREKTDKSSFFDINKS